MTHTSAWVEMVGYSTRTTNNAVGACLGEEHIPATRVSSKQTRAQGRVIVDGRADYDTVSGAVLDLVDEVGDRLADADTGTSRTGRSLSYTHTSRWLGGCLHRDKPYWS